MIKYHLFQTLKNVVRVNLLIFGQAKLSLMTVWKCSTIRKKNTFSFFPSFSRSILGVKWEFFTVVGDFQLTNGLKTKITFPGPSMSRTTFLYSLLPHRTCRFWLYIFDVWDPALLSSRKKEKISKVIIRKLPIRRKWHSETKKYRINFCFLLRSS